MSPSQRTAFAKFKKAFACRREADALGRAFKRDLARLDCGLCAGPDIQPVFDRVYHPAAIALADSLTWLGVAEVDMLRLPLCPELAATQLRILLHLLSGIAKLLDKRAAFEPQ